MLLKALGLTDGEIYDSRWHPEYFQKTIEKEGQFGEEEALMVLPQTPSRRTPHPCGGGEQLLNSRFFDPKRYDLWSGSLQTQQKIALDSPRYHAGADIARYIDSDQLLN